MERRFHGFADWCWERWALGEVYSWGGGGGEVFGEEWVEKVFG